MGRLVCPFVGFDHLELRQRLVMGYSKEVGLTFGLSYRPQPRQTCNDPQDSML